MIRRHFLKLAGSAVAAGAVAARTARAAPPPIKAIAFDAFPIFDPRPVLALAERFFPGRGTELGNAWRTRQFEYQWLRNIMGRYADFWQTTEDALVFAARLLRLELGAEQRTALMGAHLELPAWPDVPAALRALQSSGLRLALLSNMTGNMLRANIAHDGLEGLFEHVISTDRIHSYKPDPRAYQLGVNAFALDREEILFASFAGWDAAGAKSFGYPTFWVNRMGLPEETLGAAVDASGRDLNALLRHLDVAHEAA